MSKEFDAVISGAGAGGGFCAMRLAQNGLKVLLLERGRRFDFKTDFPMNYPDWELQSNPLLDPYELIDDGETPGISVDDHDICSGSFEGNEFLQDPPSHRMQMYYDRVLGVGGSTLHYQGEAHRFAPHVFQPNSLFGWGQDWPVSYNVLEPFYQQAEKLLGVAGTPGNPYKPVRENFPTAAHTLSTRSQLAKLGADKLGWSLLPNSLALPSRSVDGRSPCQHSGGCVYGCRFGAKSSTDLTAIAIGESTGNLTVQENSQLVEIETDSQGNVDGFIYMRDDQKHRVRASRYILAMGAVETPRMMLANQTGRHPEGIGNQHDQVGRNFMETIYAAMYCEADFPIHSYKGPPLDARIWDFYKPDNDLVSGFVLGVAGTLTEKLSPLSYSQAVEGFGLEHKRKVRSSFGREIQLFGIAEHIPHENNRVTLSERKDSNGIPLVKIFSDYGHEDRRTLRVMMRRIEQWADACDLGNRSSLESTYDAPNAAHVGGTCRMGVDPEYSVTDSNGQVHGVSNLYITDASVLPTLGAGDSPSLTIQALALRAAEHIVGA